MRVSPLVGASVAMLIAATASAQNLSGYWKTEGGGQYVVRHVGDEFCWYTQGVNVFCGRVVGQYIMGSWLDLPTGPYNGSGKLVLKIESADKLTKVQETARYGGTTWTRTSAPPPQCNCNNTSGGSNTGGSTNSGNTNTGNTNPGGTNTGATNTGGPAVIDGGIRDWTYRAVDVDYKIGQRVKFICTPDPQPTTEWRAVNGTDVYTGDSVVCQAAVYDGKIGRGGGEVVIEVVESPPRFSGGRRNNVLSADWEKPWPSAFRFISGSGTSSQMDVAMPPQKSDARPVGSLPPGVDDGGRIGWETPIPVGLRVVNKRVQFHCPSGGQFLGYVWGTDVYTGDSYPCAAAVHSGVITFARGGTITIEIRPGRNQYDASERNGVRSGGFGQYAISFVVLR